MNGTLQRLTGTVQMDENIAPEMRAIIDVNASAEARKIEDRIFKPFNRYFPIPQGDRDSNPELTQNEGY